MKLLCLSILCLILLSASKCKKEGGDCHYNIIIVNHSNAPVIAALKVKNSQGKCIINGPVIQPDENHIHNQSGCWENQSGNSNTYELYIVDPANYNTPQVFYSCDSIEHKNTVLKHFVLTLNELKNADFTVSYP